MKVLLISTRIYPDLGGVARQVFNQAQILSKHNHKVKVIACTPKNKSYQKILARENINFSVELLPFYAPKVHPNILILISFIIRFLIHGMYKSIKVKKSFHFNMIHAHSPGISGYIALALSKIYNIPYSYTIHGLDYQNLILLNLDLKIIASLANKLIVVSKFLKNYFLKHIGKKNIHFLPNLIDISEFYHVNLKSEKERLIQKLELQDKLSKDDFIISYIGYMSLKQKVRGMVDFIEAFSQFLEENLGHKETIKLLFIGDGKYSDKIKESIEDQKFRNNIHFLGQRNDIKDLLAISDLLALTSYTEGFPMVILEALASSVPCLATDVGSIKSMVGKAGFTVKPGTIEEITKKLYKVYNLTEKERTKLRNNALSQVKKKFNENLLKEKLLKIYFS